MKQTYFLDRDGKLHRLCDKKHRPEAKPCPKPHAVPEDKLWQGVISSGLVGEMKAALLEARKKHRQAIGRWETKNKNLLAKKVAPQFAEFMKTMIQDHLNAKPKFSFHYVECPVAVEGA